MFYSHEILTSPQHGISTVWLVAMNPRSKQYRVTKKALLDVNVPGACGTVQEPGAPIALRLQANLLYGLARVHQKQCEFVLDDTEKLQAALQRLSGNFGNSLDPNAGKAKPQSLILPDDPGFDISAELPPFNFDAMEQDLVVRGDTQGSLSQLSPLEMLNDRSSLHHAFLNIPESSPINSMGLPQPFSRPSSILGSKHGFNDPMAPFYDDKAEDIPIGDLGLDIDAEGNIVESQVHGLSIHGSEGPLHDIGALAPAAQENQLAFHDDHFGLDLGGEISAAQQPHAVPPLQHAPSAPSMARALLEQDDIYNEPQDAPQRPTARSRKVIVDEVTQISKEQVKLLVENYVERMTKENRAKAKRAARGRTMKEAREAAFDMVFGRGIGGVGRMQGVGGVEHPLAEYFAGKALAMSIGLEVPESNEDESEAESELVRHGKRRLSLEDGGIERGARRTKATPQPLAAGDDGLSVFIGDDPAIENPRALEEALLGQSPAPWNPPSSALRSAVRDSAKKVAGSRSRLSQTSPLQNRGSLLPIERFSDNPIDDGLSQGKAHPEDQQLSFSDLGAGHGSYNLSTSDALARAQQDSHDDESQYFFKHVRIIGAQKGTVVQDNEELSGAEVESQKKSNTRWVDFEQLLGDEKPPTKYVATRAFYHVLALATRGAIRVSQNRGFDTISVGVPIPPAAARGGDGDSDVDMLLGDDNDHENDDGAVLEA